MLNIAAGNPITGYNLTRSLRFRRSAGGYLNRTFGSGSQQVMTLSFWFKRGQLGVAQYLFGSYSNGSAYTNLYIESTDQIGLADAASGTNLLSTQVFRDPSAWYHIVVAIDTTQATAANRVKFYVNNVQITAFASSTYPAQNTNLNLNSATNHTLFNNAVSGATNYTDGYLAETNFVNASQLTPSSFGSYNSVSGVWQPAQYTGTYGTNGFYLPFTDNSALTTSSNVGLGKDFSGNGNYWTTNNISITSGVTYDSMTDVPTLTSPTVANFAVLNPLSLAGSGTGSLTNGNLTLTSPGTDANGTQTAGSIAVPSGKYYFEGTFTTLTSGSGYLCFGVQDGSVVISGLSLSSRAGTNTWWISDDGNYRANGGSITASGLGAFSAGNVAMIAIDASTGKGWIGKNGTWVGDPAAGTGNTFSSLPALIAPFAQAIRNTTTSSVLNANFGQRPFAYTPPTGFVALNTYNLPTPTIAAGNTVMDATLYTGNTSTQTITNAGGFKPDLVWLKSRNQAYQHGLFDSVRGSTKGLVSNSTAAEATFNSLTSFNSNGFSLNTDYNDPLAVGANYVAWQWQAGQGTTSSNTNGTITSTVSVNASAGFSVVTWTGNLTNSTVGHGLGVAPQFIIVKNRTTANLWPCYHASATASGYLALNTDAAYAATSVMWNNTAPTSSVFTVGTTGAVNNTGDAMVAYCWAPIAGYSAFGSYSANASADGPFVYTGFRPKFILFKATTTVSGGNWVTVDTTTNTYNVCNKWLFPNLTATESNYVNIVDALSNGFKIRTTWDTVNASGATMIYAAFAENPFKYSLAR